MTDRPIPFSAPMVRALLDGHKTQTRRILKPQPDATCAGFERVFKTALHFEARSDEGKLIYPFPAGKGFITPFPSIKFDISDRLWVRESYFQRGNWQPVEGEKTKGGRQKWAFVPTNNRISFDAPTEYRKGRHHADPETVAWHKRLGRFMPRWASRLTLIVTDVRVERLQDISEVDALAEGIIPAMDGFALTKNGECWGPTAKDSYRVLWDSINGEDAWESNPWVVAVSFNVENRNIDQ